MKIRPILALACPLPGVQTEWWTLADVAWPFAGLVAVLIVTAAVLARQLRREQD